MRRRLVPAAASSSRRLDRSFQTDVRAKPARPEGRRRKRRLKRRLFWTGVILALTLIWMTVQVLRAAEALLTATRSIARLSVGPDPRGEHLT
jgi:hypothetical protein